MTHNELICELIKRNALIVHFSRPSKGDEPLDAPAYPHDLLKAVKLCGTEKTEICCSVIWPGMGTQWGEIGVILKPRSTEAITMVCQDDAGTYVDPETGRRVGAGEPFSIGAAAKTFAGTSDYNEWLLDDADVVGVYVETRKRPLVIAEIIDMIDIDPEWVAAFGNERAWANGETTLDEIKTYFKRLPILTFENGQIVDINEQVVSPYAADNRSEFTVQ